MNHHGNLRVCQTPRPSRNKALLQGIRWWWWLIISEYDLISWKGDGIGGVGPLRFPRIYDLRPFFSPSSVGLSDLNISPPEVRSDDADENADVSDRTTLGGRLWSKSLSPYDIKLCIAFGAGWLIVDRIDGKYLKKVGMVPFIGASFLE